MAKFFRDTAVEAPTDQQFSNDPVPAGLYSVEITNADIADLSTGKGVGLKLEFTIIDPVQYARRKVWALLCVQHQNEATQRIAQEQLAALLTATGVTSNDADDLFGKILRIRTKVREGNDKYGPKAEPTQYMPAGVTKPSNPNVRTVPEILQGVITDARAAAAPAAPARPWAR
jgi:hypothetical protein